VSGGSEIEISISAVSAAWQRLERGATVTVLSEMLMTSSYPVHHERLSYPSYCLVAFYVVVSVP